MVTGSESLEDILEFAVDLAWQAGHIALGYFQTEVATDSKADGTPVTVADRETEKYLRSAIRKMYPRDGLVGEEFGVDEGPNERSWILDPIDGTKSFVRGVPLFGLLIGVAIDSRPVVGVMHFPALGETIAARRGGGCYWNGRRVFVSKENDLSSALVTMSEVPEPGSIAAATLDPLLRKSGDRRTWGDCFGYSMVASGRAEIMIDPEASPWDLAAIQPIIEEAGGRFSSMGGEESIWSGSAVASNGYLHDSVLELLSEQINTP